MWVKALLGCVYVELIFHDFLLRSIENYVCMQRVLESTKEYQQILKRRVSIKYYESTEKVNVLEKYSYNVTIKRHRYRYSS